MRERARLANGELAIASQRGIGTTLTMSIPIDDDPPTKLPDIKNSG
ncbi:MAG: hypothetical protein KDE34_28020 [Anaerolineales bacterium]|nr:hypothetical protein [Anaerolineales bacterium]